MDAVWFFPASGPGELNQGRAKKCKMRLEPIKKFVVWGMVTSNHQGQKLWLKKPSGSFSGNTPRCLQAEYTVLGGPKIKMSLMEFQKDDVFLFKTSVSNDPRVQDVFLKNNRSERIVGFMYSPQKSNALSVFHGTLGRTSSFYS